MGNSFGFHANIGHKFGLSRPEVYVPLKTSIKLDFGEKMALGCPFTKKRLFSPINLKR
jgi:hypothetical protein